MHDWDGVLSIYDPEETLSRGDLGTIRIEKVRELLEQVLYT